MLPYIKINFDNGNLGAVAANPDGVFGLLASAAPVAGKFEIGVPYIVKNMKDVALLGIIPDVENYQLYKTLNEFYGETGEGRELWLMGMSKDTKPSDWFTVDAATGKTPAETLLDAAKGRISGIFTKFAPSGYTPTVTAGMDSDVLVAANLAQILAVNYTNSKYVPFFVLLEGYNFNGNVIELEDLTARNYNRVAVMLGDTEIRTGTPSSLGSAIGILAGRLAKNQVHVNVGKVRDGALSNLYAYLLDTPAENFDVETLHNKGFITFRVHVGKSGYFFTDDPTASDPTDDYHYLTNRRVIDKAFRIVYVTMVNYLLSDITLAPDGTIDPRFAKAVEGDLETSIANQMTANDELSALEDDKNDKGVRCFVDPAQNVAATSRLNVSVKVRPHGYARWIEVLLGFDISQTEKN